MGDAAFCSCLRVVRMLRGAVGIRELVMVCLPALQKWTAGGKPRGGRGQMAGAGLWDCKVGGVGGGAAGAHS